MSSVTAPTNEVPPTKAVDVADAVEFIKCDCCGFTEECTVEYIARVRERHHGRWICGLCIEAVQDEIRRSEEHITTEEALDRHATFRSSPPVANPTGNLISAVRHLVRRSFESPRAHRSTSGDDIVVRRSSLARTSSCFPALAS